MSKGGKFISGIGIGFYLTILAVIATVLAWIFYARNGITDFNVELNSAALVSLGIGIGLSVFSLAADLLPFEWAGVFVKPLRYAAYLVELYALVMFIHSQVTYIANVLVSIDGTTFSSGFILTAVFFVAGAFVLLAAAITASVKPFAKKESPDPESEVNVG